MRKKYTIAMVILGILMILAFTGFAVWQSAGAKPEFPASGFLVRDDKERFQRLDFNQGDTYAVTLAGQISFRDASGKTVTVPRENFVHMDNDATFAFSEGVLLDFNDLSENFINNYYIPAGMNIVDHAGTYTADTTAGALEFGEHLWKLSDRMYLIRSASLAVHFSENDIRQAGDLVQVYITEDSVVRIQTGEEMWSTISPDCFIQTEKGVKIYPVSLLVDNGTYKLSMAKLAVTIDDAVVLTESETRRQIVPQLNIEAIDGEDGDDGTEGVAGAAGANGTDGKEGENGKGGEDGTTGKGGLTGFGGGKGVDGKDALSESSTYNSIPTMSITHWDLSSTELSGTLRVTDPSELFASLDNDKYPGKITVTDVTTGEVILCYPLSTDGTLATNPDFVFAGGENAEDAVYISFATNPGVLEPDTQYKLSVTGYYRTTNPDMTYQREFLNRMFTTDTTGVSLSYVRATTNTITLAAAIDGTQSISSAKVYLLTEEQNETITAAAIEKGSVDYVEMLDPMDSSNNPKIDPSSMNYGIGLTQLTPNTKYIARVYVVNNKTGLHALSKQELEVMTLKQNPIPENMERPSATYNRTNGAFEVWRPTINDVHGGAVSYTYTAYNANGEKVASRIVMPSAGEPVEFRLNTGANAVYKFGVTMEFFDNEKTITYDLKTSDTVIAAGETLPHMTLVKEKQEYNLLKGDIVIPLVGNSNLEVSQDKPLKVTVYADQVGVANEMEFTSLGQICNVSSLNGNLGTVTLQDMNHVNNVISTEARLNLNLTNLYHSTNYAVAVTGYLNLGDGNGAVKRAIGTVTFMTPAAATLTAIWTPSGGDGTDVLSVKLRICENTTSTVATYAMNELKKGQTTLTLYQGSGARPQQIGYKNFISEEELSQLYGEGYLVTQADFQNANLVAGQSYTLTLTGIVDSTYNMNLTYMNRFTKIVNPSKPLEATPSPPEIRSDPQNAIKVGMIKNKEAASFGGTVKTDLPGDAVVGFTLESDYDNKNRIGSSITYYAYEYQSFYNAMAALPMSGANPLDPARQTALLEMTEPIDPGSDYAPKVAVLFGGTKSTESQRHGEYQVYWAGSAGGAGTLSSGMDRGYRYIFAYTVQYEITTESDGMLNTVTGTYPNDRKDYDTFNNQFGGITLGTSVVGRSKENGYVLNSGMVEVPNIMPEFFTYLYETEAGDPAGIEADGTVTLHYTWRDPEGLITTGQSADSTKVIYQEFGVQETGSAYLATDSNKVDKDGENRQWYSVSLPFEVTRQDPCVLSPVVSVKKYDMTYSVLEEGGIPLDQETYPLTTLPVEWPHMYSFDSSTQASVDVSLDGSHNVLKFIIGGSENMDLARRAVGMRVTMSPEGSSKEDTFEVLLTMDGGSPTAKLPTSELGSAYMPTYDEDGVAHPKKANIRKVEILYDSGLQGWRYAQDDDYFTLQYTNTTVDGPAEYGPYHGALLEERLPASHALLSNTSNFKVSDLRNTIFANFDQDVKHIISIRAPLIKNYSNYVYLYPTSGGVDSSSSISTNSLSGRYEVAKKLVGLELTCNNKEVTITGMTPTMDKPSFRTGDDRIQPGNYKVYGLEGTDTIHVAAYSLKTNAETLSQDGVVSGPKDIQVDANGNPEDVTLLFEQQGEADYYLAFYYMEGGERKHLRYGTAMDIAVFDVSTSGGVKITPNKIRYTNESYFLKELSCEFSLSRPQFITARCDIYDTPNCKDRDYAGKKLLTFEEMQAGRIISGPINIAYDTGVTLNLTPDPARQKLLPGNTYYLRIEVHESESKRLAGFLVQEFTITEVGRYGALVYVSDAGKNEQTQQMEIKFQVTINDKHHSFMAPGDTDTETIQNGALYAVRFVDKDGRLLRTIYDDQLYSAYVSQKVFTLNNDALRSKLNTSTSSVDWNQIKPGENYSLLVFAVPDPEHDGVIPVYNQTAQETQDWTWSNFFTEVTDPTDPNKKVNAMNALIDSFWDMGNDPATFRNPVKEMEATRGLMQVAQKTQNSGSSTGGYVFDENSKVHVSRKDSTTFRLTFRECFNLTEYNETTKQEESVFQRIDYYITGTAGAEPVEVDGTILASKNGYGKLIQKGEDEGGYSIYYLDIPVPLEKGYYDGIFHFYETEDENAELKVSISRELTG